MKAFFQFLWADRYMRVILITWPIMFIGGFFSTGSYLGWSIWVGAFAVNWITLAFNIIRSRRMRATVARCRPQVDFFFSECQRLHSEIIAVPEWDRARQLELIAQFEEAGKRHALEVERASIAFRQFLRSK